MNPPSRTRDWPVIKDARSEHMHTTASATSSGIPNRPRGWRSTRCFRITGSLKTRFSKGVSITDGFAEVKFKSLAGKEDQAGGVVWRWKDGDNYYVARANALENNVSLYYTESGRRKTVKYIDAPVAGNTWHTLRVDFSGRSIKVALDGKTYIDLDDAHLSGGGAVGVWTKADSTTAFDDFSYGTKPVTPK